MLPHAIFDHALTKKPCLRMGPVLWSLRLSLAHVRDVGVSPSSEARVVCILKGNQKQDNPFRGLPIMLRNPQVLGIELDLSEQQQLRTSWTSYTAHTTVRARGSFEDTADLVA